MARKRWIAFGGIVIALGLFLLIAGTHSLLLPADIRDLPVSIAILICGALNTAVGIQALKHELRNGLLNASEK